ncbi:MAG: hypothetical protein FWC91_13030 [Defluviitaleaceae bacterium]|nr:hypothetical protein [Defluviitaleaceae bacterium]
MFKKLFGNKENGVGNGGSKSMILSKNSLPRNANGDPDIAAILAAQGITDVDLSKVKVFKANSKEDAEALASKFGG